ncbi:MAG: class I SAM-dependent methyltransferase [Rhodobacter sp.]|nr:class I SAM-dependent methyltransferase [Rhodobacter sp.]
MAPDLHYTDPRLAQLYDLENGWGPDSAFYLSLAGPIPCEILDLGCGTGILSDGYAALGHRVTGVDPAPAMLAVARQKPQARRIRWIASTAQSFRSDRRFDLIVMTGHAFQVLVTDAEITATFSVMRDHLAPGGRIAFETRNPAINWAQRWNGATWQYQVSGETIRRSYEVQSVSAQRIRFTTHYTFLNGSLTSTSTLRFASYDTVDTLLRASGFQVRSVFGDWSLGPLDRAASEEMIFVAGR